MGSYYYLVSQLPNVSTSMDGKSSLPFTIEEFKELCGRFLTEKECRIKKEVEKNKSKIEKRCRNCSSWTKASKISLPAVSATSCEEPLLS